MSGFGGESVHPHALTPKSGAIPRQILKTQIHFSFPVGANDQDAFSLPVE
jgi:hypothetical protein